MMHHLRKLLAVCVVCVLAGPALAEGDRAARRKRPEGREGARRARGEGREGARRERPDRMAAVLEELKLTAKQEAPVKQIFETYRQEMAQWMQENGPKMRELYGKVGRRRPGAEGADNAPKPTEEERKAAMEKLREIQKTRQGINENLLKQLKDHLTEEQMAVVRRRLAGGGRGAASWMSFRTLSQLDLDAAQQTKVREIMRAAREASQGKGREEAEKAMKEAWAKIEKDVLTVAQAKKLAELKKAGPRRAPAGGARGAEMFAGLDLTKEQTAKMQEAQAEMRKKMQEADREDRRALYQEYRKKIDEILTPEQREKLQQRRKEMMERRSREGAGRERGARRKRDEPVAVD